MTSTDIQSTIIVMIYLRFLFFLLLLPVVAEASSIGSILKVIGDAHFFNGKEKVQLKKGDEVKLGQTIFTGARSICRVRLADHIVFVIGPNSKSLLDTKFLKKKNLPIINLMYGKMRIKVEKAMDEIADESNLIIKSESIALGVRGTDFLVSHNQKNRASSLVTFSGKVRMTEAINSNDPKIIDQALNSPNAVEVTRGQFSYFSPEWNRVTLPTKIAPGQLESLKRNESFSPPKAKNRVLKKYRSIVPEGTSAKDINLQKTTAKANIIESDRPRLVPGGFVDLKTSLYVSPTADSQYDENHNVYIPSIKLGRYDGQSGEYQAPAGYRLKEDGYFEKTDNKIIHEAEIPNKIPKIRDINFIEVEAPKVLINEYDPLNDDETDEIGDNITEDLEDTEIKTVDPAQISVNVNLI